VISNSCFVSKLEPKNVKEALTNEFRIDAMQEELNQFKRSDVWDLVPRPEGINVIGTKWIYKNKSDENGTVTRNKARLVAQGYTQLEDLDFDETFRSGLFRVHKVAFGSGLFTQVHIVPDGCEECLSKWLLK